MMKLAFNYLYNKSFISIKFQQKYYLLNQNIIYKNFVTNYVEKACVYIHWPYCKHRCSYCGFVKFIPKENSFWSFSNNVIEDGMVNELEHILKITPIKTITSVFFGGGTPSLARPQLVERIMNTIEKNCSVTPNLEITLEANPTSLETSKLEDFKFSGVNRLSLGIQSLQEEILRVMQRNHSVKESLQCLEKAQKIYSQNVSVDLIFAFPDQTLKSWKRDLEFIANLSLQHLSLYQLTLERGTLLFNQIKKGALALPDENAAADMYEFAVHFLSGGGLHRYEVSNFARGPRWESGHNKAVWQGSQYVGIGPGAHSRLVRKGSSWVREARINAADPQSWLSEVRRKGHGARKITPQTREDSQMEYLATSLRTREGALEGKWRTFSAAPLSSVFPLATLDPTFFSLEGDRLRATPKGINVLDKLLPALINRLIKFNSIV